MRTNWLAGSRRAQQSTERAVHGLGNHPGLFMTAYETERQRAARLSDELDDLATVGFYERLWDHLAAADGIS